MVNYVLPPLIHLFPFNQYPQATGSIFEKRWPCLGDPTFSPLHHSFNKYTYLIWGSELWGGVQTFVKYGLNIWKTVKLRLELNCNARWNALSCLLLSSPLWKACVPLLASLHFMPLHTCSSSKALCHTLQAHILFKPLPPHPSASAI